MEGPSWTGDYRAATASDGCVIFRNIPIEKTDYEGILAPVIVYPIVSGSNYATYNGKLEGNMVEVQPQRITPLNVRLNRGENICITVMNGEEALEGADVSLCANAQCTQILETKKTQSDGHVAFSSDAAVINVKVVSTRDRITKEKNERFTLSQVSNGQCGTVDLATVTQYATVSLQIEESLVEAMPNSNVAIEFIAMINDQPATGGTMSGGKILGAQGTEMLVELTGDIGPSTLRVVNKAEGKYAIEFYSPMEEDIYRAILNAEIPNCETCQGDKRYLTIEVGDGDEDDDGVPDEDDECPGTPGDTAVDADGCPTIDGDDSDGDGVPDMVDNCPNTLPGVQVGYDGCEIAGTRDTDGDGIPDEYDSYPNDPDMQYPNQDVNDNGIPDMYDSPSYHQSSIQVCVVDSIGAKVYDADVIMYHSPSDTGSGYGGYANGYGQPWRTINPHDNCRTFIGYSSYQNLNINSFISSFQLRVSAEGYEEFTPSSDSIRLVTGGPEGIFSVEIILRRREAKKTGGGDITNPAREVELSSANWKVQTSERKDQVDLHPLVTLLDNSIILKVRYSIDEAARDEYDYSIKYTLEGAKCYEIERASDVLGRSTLTFLKGQDVVEDEGIIYSKDDCWNMNDPALESEFRITLQGQLLQIGDREATSSMFPPTRINMKPLVGATKKISSISDLTELNGIMTLGDGVVTVGSLPNCIDERGNTGKSRMVSMRGVEDQTAADHKIVIEFKGKNAGMQDLMDIISKISDYIRTRFRKSPVDCETYLTVKDKYMGYIIIGQSGFNCLDAGSQEGAKLVEPWEKLFCTVIESGSPQQIPLGGSYAMKVDSK
jgi:hypothetical protein